MATRSVYLIRYPQPGKRAHMGIWIPYSGDGTFGTVINVVGSPETGFDLEFKRRYAPEETKSRYELTKIGLVNTQHVHDWTGDRLDDSTAIGDIEKVAQALPAPGRSNPIELPADGIPRTCQWWTWEFVKRLAEMRYIHSSAADIVRQMHDPPAQQGQPVQGAQVAQQQPQQLQPWQVPQQQTQYYPQQQQTASYAQQQTATVQAQALGQTQWIWDAQYNKYKHWNGTQWIWR